MANKYLDANGLLYLWGKIKAKFATKDELVPLENVQSDWSVSDTASESYIKNKPGNASTTATGLMTSDMVTKLNGIAEGANQYTLPTASSTVLGGVKIGSNITIASGVVSVTEANIQAALGYTPLESVADMTGATSSAAGTNGLVPAPAAGKQTSFLRGDGTWVVPTDTTYNVVTTTTNGLMSSEMLTKLNGIAEDANKTVVDTALSSTSTNPVQNKVINTELDKKISSTEKGAVNGVATLDSSGLVPSNQLPSYVDDVIEGYYYAGEFYKESAHTTVITGESGKIYVDLTTNYSYRYGGSTYVEITSSDMVTITNAEIDVIVAS